MSKGAGSHPWPRLREMGSGKQPYCGEHPPVSRHSGSKIPRDSQGGEVKAERESALPSLREALLWVHRKHQGLALPCQGLCWDERKG